MTISVAHITTVDLSLKFLLFNQLRSLQDAGYEITGISAPGPYADELAGADIRHIAVPMRREIAPLADLVSFMRLYKVLRREKFTIVHTHNPKPGLLGQAAARMAGVPVIVNTIHGYYIHDNMLPLQMRFFVFLEKLAAAFSDHILSQNSEDIKLALTNGICNFGKISLLGNGIDISTFSASAVPQAAIERQRANLALNSDTRVVGFVGRLAAKRKGFRDFLAAGQKLLQRMPEDVRFLIIGEPDAGKADAVLPQVAREYGIFDRCIFLGKRPNVELPSLYALMDVLVLPSLFEGVPRALMEATAMQVPIVATDVKGNREVVESGYNGFLVPLGDTDALTSAIQTVLGNPEKARQMGAAGRRIAVERFDERLVFEKVKATYARLLEKKGLTAPASHV